MRLKKEDRIQNTEVRNDAAAKSLKSNILNRKEYDILKNYFLPLHQK